MNGIEKEDKDQEKSIETDVSLLNDKSKDNAKSQTTWDDQKVFWLKLITIMAFATRFFKIYWPAHTVFDELHHGKFITWYVRREYYLDVHPPLGRLLFAAVAELFGYDGSFDFEKHDHDFNGSLFPHVAIRSLSGILGVITSALTYSILVEMKYSLQACIIGASLVVFDNSLTIISRIFILESQLICYMVFTCYCWVRFRSYNSQPFSALWWQWLALTGFGIGLSIGVKFVGLFLMLAIGIFTIYDLWDVCRVKKTPSDFVVLKHWLARSFCLILIPVVCFIVPYWIHIRLLYKSGNGDGFMSLPFQTTLEGNKITNATFPVYYGSTIKIKSHVENVWLHSHVHTYPLVHGDNKVSSQGQQVTGYGHKDGNNDWIILPANEGINSSLLNYNETRMLVKNGDYIRLMHVQTRKYLLTSNVASPLTLTNQEVTAVEWNGTIDEPNANKTIWKIVPVGSLIGPNHTVNEFVSKISIFRLLHNETNCLLLNYQQNLPQWAYGQREINAAKSEVPATSWSVDDVTPADGWSEEDIKAVREKNYFADIKPSFWSKFIEVVQVSLTVNSKLIDPNSKLFEPIDWPLMTKGMHFWFDKEGKARIYLLGNPFAWYICLLSLPIFVAILVLDLFLNLRGRRFLTDEQRSFAYPKGCFFFVCYCLHYLPFFFMGRILYFHHYLPAYLLNAMVFVTVYQIALIRLPCLGYKSTMGVILLSVVATFWHFSALVYGSMHETDYFQSLKWRNSWHFI